MQIGSRYRALAAAVALLLPSAALPALAQQPGAPPAVGTLKVERRAVTRTTEYVGRIQAPERVNLVARVTAFLEQRLFTEGAEVRKGDLLYRLEQGPFQADVQTRRATIAQITAQLQDATVRLGRARQLMAGPAGQQANLDTAQANQQALQAQLAGAQAQLQQAQINLGYTEIRAPIDGKIGRTLVTPGNVVGPGSGTLATLVSQDPMYVVFPVSVRAVMELRERMASRGGLGAVMLRVRLPSGVLHAQPAVLDFIDNAVASTTDTIVLRGTVANPLLADGAGRALVDDSLVTIVVEDAQPLMALSVPRAAVLSDQQGDFVYVVDGQSRAVPARVKLGPSPEAATASVLAGLEEGQSVIVEGIQRVRPNQPVSPAAASAPAPAAPRS